MSRRSKAWERYAEATAPRADAVERVSRAVQEALNGPPVLHVLEAQAPRPVRRVDLGAVLKLGLGVVAVVMTVMAGQAWQDRVRGLSAPGGWAQSTLGPGVHATFRGEGRVRGHTPPRVSWRQGAIELSVDPAAGQAVTVVTLEAEIKVVGTLLTVTRDALGTRVAVSHGAVEVRCAGGEARPVRGGQSELCVPVTVAGLLARAQALEREGAASPVVLEAVDAGLALADADGLVAGELRAFRIQHLIRTGDHAEALARIDAYLAMGTVLRRTQMLRAAARLSAGRCEAVRAYLDAIPRGERTLADRELRSACGPARGSGHGP